MSKAFTGASVLFGGHDGWFTADIYRVGNCNVVRANGRVDLGELVRGKAGVHTHHLVDYPDPGFWRSDLGVFVVPEAQVKETAFGRKKRSEREKPFKHGKAKGR